jgi:glycosyltransferase involved in cell wall biosynthesis
MERFVAERTKIYEALDIRYTILTTTFSTEKHDESRRSDNVIRMKEYTPYNIVPGMTSLLTDDYDIVSVNLLGRYYSDRAILRYAGRRQRIILTPYFTFHTDRLRAVKRVVEKFLFPMLLKHLHAMIVFTEYERRYWIERYAVPAEKIFVIPPYIALPQRLPVQPGGLHVDRYFLYVGRAAKNKKTDLLLKAFLDVPEVPRSLFLTIRPDDVPDGLRRAVLNDPRIRLLGFVEEAEKERLIAGAEALIFPTTMESFGYVAFEAAAASKPLLCSDIPVLRELHDPNGVVFFRNEVDDLIRAIRMFEGIEEERKHAMGRANFENLARFSFATACAKYSEMFSELGGM